MKILNFSWIKKILSISKSIIISLLSDIMNFDALKLQLMIAPMTYSFLPQNQTFQNFAGNYFTSFIVHYKFSIKIDFLPWQVSLIARGKTLLFKCTLKWILKQFRALTFGRDLLIMKCRRIGSDYQNNETEHTSAKSIMYIAEMYY